MSALDFPILSRSEVETPASGSFTIFRDKDNGGLLTAKDSDCAFVLLDVNINDDQEVACVCERTEEIIEAASCALKKGMMTALEYQSIVDSLSVSLVRNVDPLTGSTQIIIQNVPAIFASLSLVHVLCNGASTGTATPTITGGTAPLVLTWGGGVNPSALAAGAHTLTVTDANGQVKLVGFNITEPSAVAGALTSTPDTGGGVGTATVVASGGTPGYTYLWNDPGTQTTPTATGLLAGSYDVTVTDSNGCATAFGPIVVA